MSRVNLSVAIVAMTMPTSDQNKNDTFIPYCIREFHSSDVTTTEANNITNSDVEIEDVEKTLQVKSLIIN